MGLSLMALRLAESNFLEQELAYILLLAIAASLAFLTRYVRPFRRVPYTVALVCVGLVVAVISDRLPLNIQIPISSDLILALFVPPLIFESTLRLKWSQLKDNLAPILLLALGGTLISTFLVAVVLANSQLLVGLPFAAAVAFGALISATDPVAVISFFRTLGVGKRLTVLVEGESLFNDGVAIVIFSLAVGAGAAATAAEAADPITVTSALVDFLIIAGGGLLVGTVLGGVASHIVLRNVDDHLIETVTTVTVAFGSFLVAEQFGEIINVDGLHLSGILAVVAAGLFIGNVGRYNTSPTTAIALDSFWELFAFIVNAFVFLAIGLTVNVTRFLSLEVAREVLLAVVVVLVSRFLVVYGLTFLHGRLEPKRALPGAYRQVLVWGGLRGAIGLALALTLVDGPFANVAEELQLMAFGVVLFTLLVQGMTIESRIKKLGLAHQSEQNLEQGRLQAQLVATYAGKEEVERLIREGVLSADIGQAMQVAYDAQVVAQKQAFRAHLRHFPELEQTMVMQARLDLLRAERTALSNAARRGLVAEAVFEEMVREIDDRLVALETLEDNRRLGDHH